MKVLEGLYYSKEHEWVKVEGGKAYIGITDYAQHQLGDIVYVELPDEDMEVEASGVMCSVESVKAASDIISPVSGTVVEINEDLDGQPELLNQDPYEAWIAALELNDTSELDELMDAASYARFCQEEA